MAVSDQEARKLISTSLDKNYFVEASAGSGKTTSLVLRMIALVESGVPVDKICTITFTKAAANEFFSRFQEGLSIRSTDAPNPKYDKALGPSNAEKRKLCQEALNNIDLCFLGTIDSFCNMVAHELPTELDLPNDSEIISKQDLANFFKEEYDLMLADKNHKNHDLAIKVNKYFYPPYECFAAGLDVIKDNRDATIKFDNKLLNDDVDEYLKDEKKWLKDLVVILCRDGAAKFDSYKGVPSSKYEELRKLRSYKYKIINLPWKESLSFVSRAIKSIKEMDGFSKGIAGNELANSGYVVEPTGKAKTYKFTDEIKKSLEELEEKINEYLYTILMTLLLEALRDIADKLKKQGKFTFYDYLLYLTEKFQESASTDQEIVKHIYHKHQYFLIDESQDTNPLQTQMFFYLTSEHPVPNGDWTQADPIEGSLFIVGDPKQSIYAFRGANVKAYLKTKELFKAKDEVLILSNNYRSNPALKQWFNDTMDGILNKGAEAIEHKNIPDEDKDGRKDLINGEPKILDGVFRYITGDSDPETVANIINYLVNGDDDYVILPKDPAVIRPIKYSDFLIVPRTKDVAKYIETFEQNNIPFIIEAEIPFEKAESLFVVRDILYLLKEPNNASNLTNVLLGEAFNLTELDLIEMRKNGFNLSINEYNPEEVNFTNPIHKDIIELLVSLYRKTMNMSFSSTMMEIINNEGLNIFAKVSSKYLEYTYFLVEKVKEQENSGLVTSLKQLKDYIDVFLGDSDESRSLRFKDEVNCVKISNLHKVKGLQAPIVMLIKPVSNDRDPNKYVDYEGIQPVVSFSEITRDTSGGNKFAFVKTKQFSDDETKTKWKGAQEAEDKRLEYVAATRPESVLFIGEPSKKNSNQHNPWGNIIENVKEYFPIAGKDITGFAQEPDTVNAKDITFENEVVNKSSLKPSYEIASPSTVKVKNVVTNEEDELSDDEKKAKEDATTQGTLVHALMEYLVTSKNSFNKEELINSLLDEYENASMFKETISNVYDVITQGGFEQFNSSLNKDVLSLLLKAKNVMCEVPFSFKDGNQIVYGVIDCLYEDESGWHIIDYKTNKLRDVSKLEKEYESQLSLYKKALSVTLNINADAHIYHIDI